MRRCGYAQIFDVEFVSDDDEAKVAAAEAVWVLSFVSENRAKILAKDEILYLLKTIKSTTSPKE